MWSPMDFPVGYLAKEHGTLENHYHAGGALAMASIEGEMHLIHRVGVPGKSTTFSEVFGPTGILTAESQGTNGYGTLDQAGWTMEQKLLGVLLESDSPLAMGSAGNELMFVYRQAGGTQLHYCTGRYRTP